MKISHMWTYWQSLVYFDNLDYGDIVSEKDIDRISTGFNKNHIQIIAFISVKLWWIQKLSTTTIEDVTWESLSISLVDGFIIVSKS